jgi:hypothetical protein
VIASATSARKGPGVSYRPSYASATRAALRWQGKTNATHVGAPSLDSAGGSALERRAHASECDERRLQHQRRLALHHTIAHASQRAIALLADAGGLGATSLPRLARRRGPSAGHRARTVAARLSAGALVVFLLILRRREEVCSLR